MLRKAFCGFAVHAAKSDESLKGLRSSIGQRFLDKLKNGAQNQGLPAGRGAPEAGTCLRTPVKCGKISHPGRAGNAESICEKC
ncbi:MAG: hypothetical protein UIK34_11120, partial [Christensenellales bacterium]|nr:hypothetical protein [Christensenellales bacterium]